MVSYWDHPTHFCFSTCSENVFKSPFVIVLTGENNLEFPWTVHIHQIVQLTVWVILFLWSRNCHVCVRYGGRQGQLLCIYLNCPWGSVVFFQLILKWCFLERNFTTPLFIIFLTIIFLKGSLNYVLGHNYTNPSYL